MLVTGGFILTQLDEARKAALLAEPEADYFVGHGRVMKRWVVVRIRDPAEIERFVPFIEASYAAAAPKAGERIATSRPPSAPAQRSTRSPSCDGPDAVASSLTSTATRRRRARRARPRSPR